MNQASNSQQQISQNSNGPQNGGRSQMLLNIGRQLSNRQETTSTFNSDQRYEDLVNGANPFNELQSAEIFTENTQ
ncbi:7981_t:CDS:2 [Dentiscutata erythropus]|uniref:7981_t:CDS:1 n=1 Tax=Dentiscutata erythropus TaxID=1348616 RepID=A0A9N8Z0T9_9GLOM|nr:7981_t:CDS:2 [Dentiscutata erythropus]